MTEMIERVARELCEADGYDPDKACGSGLEDWFYYRDDAIAAIKAMREPTVEMLDASWHQAGESKEMRTRTHVHYKRHYQTMIDAALGE